MLARVQGQKGREEEKLPSRLASATAVLTASPLKCSPMMPSVLHACVSHSHDAFRSPPRWSENSPEGLWVSLQ